MKIVINKEYIQQQRKKAAEKVQRFNADKMNQAMGRTVEGLEQPGYNPSTFLYMKAYDADSGQRPVPSGIICYLSPAIELYLNGAAVDTTHALLPNTHYTVQVTVCNGGDMACSSCTVDAFLTPPSISMVVNDAMLLGAAVTSVPAHSSATVEFPFTTAADMVGHRCMFARAYSIVTNDRPSSFSHFDTRGDRHIAQQNLDILPQGSAAAFNVAIGGAHAGKELIVVLSRADEKDARLTAAMKAYRRPRAAVDIDLFKIRQVDVNVMRALTKQVAPARQPLATRRIAAPLSPSVRKVAAVAARTVQRPDFAHLRPVKGGAWAHRFQEGINNMTMDVPNLGLKPGEAVPMHLLVKDPETGHVIGGIVVLITG